MYLSGFAINTKNIRNPECLFASFLLLWKKVPERFLLSWGKRLSAAAFFQ